MTRWCDSAVVWSLSRASVAVSTAVEKPKVISVAFKSLSMVLGTPITGTPNLTSSPATFRVPSPPITIKASIPYRFKFSKIRGTQFWGRTTPCSSGHGYWKGLARLLVPNIVPPRGNIPITSVGVMGLIQP